MTDCQSWHLLHASVLTLYGVFTGMVLPAGRTSMLHMTSETEAGWLLSYSGCWLMNKEKDYWVNSERTQQLDSNYPSMVDWLSVQIVPAFLFHMLDSQGNFNSFEYSSYIFLLSTVGYCFSTVEAAFPLRLWVFLLGSCPFFCWWLLCLACFLVTKRKSGWGICGSSVLRCGSVFVCWCGSLLCTWPQSHVLLFSLLPLIFLLGPSHWATSAKLEEKKKSVSGINSTVGLPEKFQVDTIDEVTAMVKRCMQLHGGACRLVGRTYDLKRAYRQLGYARSITHYRFSWIAVWSTDHQEVKLFRMKGLPFGGTASVAAFLRISKALKELGIMGASLAWSSFFDDCISRPEDMCSADMIVRFLFRSTGWVLSEDPKKDVGFQQCFAGLGVEFDLSSVHEGTLRIGNTAKHKAELRTMVERHLAEDSLSADDSEWLRSRLMFAESQDFSSVFETGIAGYWFPVCQRSHMCALGRGC